MSYAKKVVGNDYFQKNFKGLDDELTKLSNDKQIYCVFVQTQVEGDEGFMCINNLKRVDLLNMATAFYNQIKHELEISQCGKKDCIGCRHIEEMVLHRLAGKDDKEYPIIEKMMQFFKDKLKGDNNE